MRRVSWLLFVLVSCGGTAVLAQQPEAGRKQARAVRVAPGAVAVDGRLNEDAWTTAPPIADFTQKEPDEGAQPSDAMQVAFAYDDTALYIGARMTSDHAPIQAPLGRRDEAAQSEYIVIALDTYLDHRTAYGFGVTASGVRLDRFYAADAEDFDATSDPVWEARTRIDDHGWTAEMWIPLSQLRFNARDEQVWGLNVQRFVPSNNEEDYWIAVPRTEKAWASRFGELRGIDGVRPPRRIELLPYVAGSSTLTGDRDRRNPFDDGKNLGARTGADVKVGFGSNLTLDATVNPDFGQVEADPAEVNLSAYETFFTEKRPFFTEGSGLLQSRFDTFFYSRRIGAAPVAPVAGDFVDYPRASTILGAAKLTGRLRSKTSIGVLSAVTAGEHASTVDLASSTRARVTVAPMTSYSVGRVQQEFGPNASTVALMMTAVHRDLRAGDPLAALLARNAFTMNGDSMLRFKQGMYELSAQAGLTRIDGEPEAIARVQRNSAHYFQRPDLTYSRYDPARRSMTGGYGALQLARTGGRHWLWDVAFTSKSPEYEVNDIGRLQKGDGITSDLNLIYRATQPQGWLRSYTLKVARFNEWNYGGNPQNDLWSPSAHITWLNFWITHVQFWQTRPLMDDHLTRGGPVMKDLPNAQTQIEIDSPEAATTQAGGGTYQTVKQDGGRLHYYYGTFMARPAPQWQLSIKPTISYEIDARQYVATLDGGPAETFGARYIFARVDRATYSTQFRVNYTFKPDMTVDVYMEPFAASGAYGPTQELVTPRTSALRPFDVPGNRDFNTKSLRSNVVLRWEWKPGSTLFVVWQQNRAATDLLGSRATLGDMFHSITVPGDHVLAVKTTFWISGR